MKPVVVPGSEQIKSIAIINEDEKNYTRTELIATSVTIVESMASYGTTATVYLTDTNDIIGLLPVLGHEKVVIEFQIKNDPGINKEKEDGETREEIFRIASVNKVEPIRDETPGLKYALNLISEFTFMQEFFKVDEAFSNTVSNCIKSIHNKVLNTPHGEIKIEDTDKFKLDKIDTTDGVVNFIGPNFTPYTTIEMLQSWAYSDTFTSSAYVYFQNKNGFNFRTFDSLAKDSLKPGNKFYYKQDGTEKLARAGELNRISGFTQQNRGDAFHLASEGRLSHKVAELDFIKKTVDYSVYNYEKNVDKYNIFGTKVFGGKKFMGNIASIPTQTHWLYRDGSKKSNYFSSGFKHKWAIYRLMYNNMLSISIPGNANVTAGDIINIKVPQGNIGINVKNQDKNDKFLSGNYIARDVIHHFNRVGYNTQINCIRSGSKDQMHEP